MSDWLTKQFLDWQKLTERRQTVTSFAAHLGVSRDVLNQWMNGRRKPSTLLEYDGGVYMGGYIVEHIAFHSPAATAAEHAYQALLARVTRDPAKLGGAPCVRGLRIPISVILDDLAAGMSPAQIIADYPLLEPDDIRAACAYASQVVDPD